MTFDDCIACIGGREKAFWSALVSFFFSLSASSFPLHPFFSFIFLSSLIPSLRIFPPCHHHHILSYIISLLFCFASFVSLHFDVLRSSHLPFSLSQTIIPATDRPNMVWHGIMVGGCTWHKKRPTDRRVLLLLAFFICLSPSPSLSWVLRLHWMGKTQRQSISMIHSKGALGVVDIFCFFVLHVG